MHKHDHCNHERVKYCTHCNVVYCEVCGKEWRDTWYTYPDWTKRVWYSDYDTTTNKIDNQMLAKIECKHGVNNG